MKRPMYFTGTSSEVREKIQENYDRILENNQKWIEIMTFDPDPQTGMTPKDVVWRKNKARLYRYISPGGHRYRTPLLMIYALINKAYILDITPGMSMVEHLVDEGFDVYLLDWGEFHWEDRNLSMADFVFDYISRAVRKVCQTSGTDELNMLGYCMGGTLTTMYASLFPRPVIKNIIYVAAPIDFEDAGVTSAWLMGEDFDVDDVADTFGLIPKEFIDRGIKLLNPVNNYWGTYTRLWKMIDDGLSVQNWKVLNKWVNDNVHFPGAAYRQWLKDFYQGNKLIKKEILLRGHPVDISRIKSNLLIMVGEKDHIVMPHQSAAALKYMSSTDTTFQEYPVGHGGLVFGGIAKRQVYPAVAEWLGKRS